MKKKKKKVLKADKHAMNIVKRMYKGKCQLCGFNGNIYIHHIRPIHYGGTNDLNNLACICGNCHYTVHNNGDYNGNPDQKLTNKLARINSANTAKYKSRLGKDNKIDDKFKCFVTV